MTAGGPPPLAPFGLVLHHEGSWSHEGVVVTHPRLRAVLDRGVRWAPAEGVYVVRLAHFRGQIEVEEAAFFIGAVDLGAGRVRLADGSWERLEPASLHVSPRDGALLCHVARPESGGAAGRRHLARFSHSAQAELLLAAEPAGDGWVLPLAGRREALPAL